ncbi:Flp family type IVb pilin [Comamonas sp. F1-6]|uniref:Flp family type IVb pilin n=1 Tax=Comamonas sp. F1-6 TaxID=673550 RepID=UPI0031E0DEB8
MNSIAQQFGHSLQAFVQDEEGAQIIEYALVVAVVSIGLIVLMKSSISNTLFSAWLTKVKDCLINAATCT